MFETGRSFFARLTNHARCLGKIIDVYFPQLGLCSIGCEGSLFLIFLRRADAGTEKSPTPKKKFTSLLNLCDLPYNVLDVCDAYTLFVQCYICM